MLLENLEIENPTDESHFILANCMAAKQKNCQHFPVLDWKGYSVWAPLRWPMESRRKEKRQICYQKVNQGKEKNKKSGVKQG